LAINPVEEGVVDEYCPECGANIGEGVYESIGCPACGSEPEDVVHNITPDSEPGEEEE
jgi:Zn finger protein HypA/HybF involved in hydrogenase expression